MDEKKSLLSTKLPVPKELVLLEDSDEDSETDLSEESEFEADLSSLETSSDDDNLTVEQKLENIIKKSISKFDLEYQQSAAVENLTKRSYHLFYILPHVT